MSSMSSVLTSKNLARKKYLTWISSQRASLVRILARLGRGLESKESEVDSFGNCSELPKKQERPSSSLKTLPLFACEAGEKLSDGSWRTDIPGKTERLRPLMSGRCILENDGGSLLPTLMVSGNYNRKGASKTSGDGLFAKIRYLSTLMKSDARRGGMMRRNYPRLPYQLKKVTWMMERGKLSEYPKGIRTSKLGINFSPEYCEWYMGWPIGWTA